MGRRRRTGCDALCPALLGIHALPDRSRSLCLCVPRRRQDGRWQEDGWREGRDGCRSLTLADQATLGASGGQLFSDHGDVDTDGQTLNCFLLKFFM